MKRLVSGVKPTGVLHIGNYLGAIKQWVELQREYDCYFFIADYHSLTIRPKPEDLKEQTYEFLAMLVALGIEPKRSTFFVQSSINEHSELAWIMSTFTTMGELERMTQYKEKSQKFGQNAGLFTYPILMAADVAMLGGEVVPVGDDQVQHLELAREIIRKINKVAGPVLVEPKPLITKHSRIMSLSDSSKKMSKTEPAGCLFLSDDETTVERKIRRAVSDSGTGSSASDNLFNILDGFADQPTIAHFAKLKATGKLQYSELKAQIAEDIIDFLKPVQRTYKALIADKKHLDLLIKNGKEQVEPLAIDTLKQLKKSLGLIGHLQ